VKPEVMVFGDEARMKKGRGRMEMEAILIPDECRSPSFSSLFSACHLPSAKPVPCR
jgi:hypothetical protein